MSKAKKNNLRVVNSSPKSEKLDIPWLKIGLTSAFGAAVVYGTVEAVKYLRKKAKREESQAQDQPTVAQLAQQNPAMFQTPFMQQLAAMNGVSVPHNPMLATTTEVEVNPPEGAPKWFAEYAARVAALEEAKVKTKRTKKRARPRVVKEEYEEYEEDEYEEGAA